MHSIDSDVRKNRRVYSASINSWDLFDTLVAARSGRAGDTVIEDHFPIIENVSKVQPPI